MGASQLLTLWLLLAAAPEVQAFRSASDKRSSKRRLAGASAERAKKAQSSDDAILVAQTDWSNSSRAWGSMPFGVKPGTQDVGTGKVFVEAFTVMTTAEMFDRTWFMTLVCSLNHGWGVAFVGSVLALAIHAVLAVFFGAMVAGMIPKLVLELVSALLFGSFALFYAICALRAEKGEDVAQTHFREAEEEVQGETPVKASSGTSPNGRTATAASSVWRPLTTVFLAIFVAEWGDRTQLVMIGLSAAMPAIPVLLGAFAALVVLCLSAVVFARMLEGTRVDERIVNGLCAISFGVIAVIAFIAAAREALVTYQVF